ncbi:MAG: hypothetical protein NTV57_19970, partial [Cyanobacteria bacterium]|nr:hypothetical protein [Cyanobacteriota bacterium]
QLFRDQKSGIFQLASSGLREPERIDRLLLIVAIAVLVGSLQGYAISPAGLRRQVDAHPPAGSGALHSRPRRQAPPEAALVHAD